MTTAVVTTPTFGRSSDEPWDILERAGVRAARPRDNRPLEREELLASVGSCNALIVGLDPIDRDVFAAAPDLAVVAKHGVGYDNIDVAAARDHRVEVVFAPGSNSRAVAELTFGLLLDAARRISTADRSVRAGQWPRIFGSELAGRRLAVIGFGRIGRLVGGFAKAFGMTVLACDPAVSRTDLDREGVVGADLETCLTTCDVVSLHLPRSPGDGPLLDRDRLRSMRAGSILINTARGGLVDEVALAELLHDGHLGAAAFDAFIEEPLGDSPLKDAPNLVLTPHIGACTHEANRAMGTAVASDVVHVLNGRSPVNSASAPAATEARR